VVVAVLAAALALLRSPPAFLLDSFTPKLEATLSEAIGAPVRIGRIQSVTLGLLRQEVVVGKLSLAESPDRPQATFVAADEVRIRWSGLVYALGSKAPADIQLVHPQIRLRLDKQGRFGFQPAKPAQPSTGPYPHGPDLTVRWELADVLWQDERVKVAKTLHLPQGTATLGDLRHLTWKTGGTLDQATLTTTGKADLESGKGEAALQFANLDAVPFLAYSPKLPVRVAKGQLTGQARVRFDQWGDNGFSAQGTGTVATVIRSQHWRGDLIGDGRWRLTERQIAFDPLTAKLAGQPITVKGRVVWKPKLRYDLTATGNRIALAKLAAAVPSLQGKPLGGEADLTAVIRGETFAVTGTITGRGLSYGPYKTDLTHAPYRLDEHGISLQPRTGFGGGTIDGRIAVDWRGPVRMTVDADLAKIPLRTLIPGLKGTPGLPEALEGHIHLAGPPADPQMVVTVRSGAFGLPSRLPPLRDIRVAASGSVTAGDARVTAAVAGGTLAVAARWAGDALRGQVALHDVPATILRPWVPDVAAGRLDWEGRLAASRRAMERDWRAFDATGTLGVAGLVWQGRPAVSTLSHWGWHDGGFRLAGDGLASGDRLNVAVNGRLPRQNPGVPPMTVAWRGDVANLAPWLPATDVQRGAVHTEGKLHYARGWAGDAHLRVANLDLKQADLGGGRLHVQMAGNRITVRDGVWSRGEEQLRLSGNVVTGGPSPVLALQARIEQASVERLAQQYRALTKRESDRATLPEHLPVTDRLPRLDKRPAVLNGTDLAAGLPAAIPLLGVLDYWTPIARMYPPLQTPDSAQSSNGVRLAGRLSAYVRITGTARRPVVTGSGALTDVSVEDNRIASARFRGQWAGSRWNLNELTVLSGNGGVLRASGEVTDGRVAIQANGKGIDIGLLKPVMAPYGYVLTGGTDLELDVSGHVNNPTAILSLQVNHGRLNTSPFDSLDLLAAVENGAIDISRLALRQGSKGATMNGHIPLSTDQPMELAMRADDDSLGLMSLFTRQAEWLSGRGLFVLSVTGTPLEPKLDGRLVLKNARLYLPGLGETLDNLNGTVLFNNRQVPVSRSAGDGGAIRTRTQNQIDVAALTGRYNGGQVSVSGNIELPWRYEPGFWGLRVNANDILVRRGGLYDGRASAALTIRNELSDPVISGKVTLPKGVSTLSRGAQSEVAAGGSTTRRSTPPFRISNLRVEVGEEFWVRTPIFELQPHGMVVIDWRNLADSPMVRGKLTATKGTLTLTSYQFKITKAQADFIVRDFDHDVSPINPKLDLTLTGSIPNPRTTDRRAVPVEGHLTAFLENLETQNAFKLSWKNDAGLSDEEINKVVTGGTISQVASGNITQVASDISPLVTRALFDPITDRLAQLLALDEVNIGLGSSLADPAFRLSLTKPLYGGLSLGFSRIFAAQPTTTFSLRYRVANNLSLSYEYEDPRDRTALGTMSAQFNARF
jgi:autotransporter translocation and assembly factor TamB